MWHFEVFSIFPVWSLLTSKSIGTRNSSRSVLLWILAFPCDSVSCDTYICRLRSCGISSSFTSLSPPISISTAPWSLSASRALMEERPSPCHDGNLQPLLSEGGSHVEEKLPLYRATLSPRSTHCFSHAIIAVKSLYLFSTYLKSTHYTKMILPSFFLFFSEDSAGFYLEHKVKFWKHTHKDQVGVRCEKHFNVQLVFGEQWPSQWQGAPWSSLLRFLLNMVPDDLGINTI